MKKFIVGLIIGVAIGLPIGVNWGKGVPILTNPFAEKPFSQQFKETAEAAKKTIHEATK